MAPLKGDPITKVTIFLYTEDIAILKRRYGYGWSTYVREVIRQWLKKTQTHASQEE